MSPAHQPIFLLVSQNQEITHLIKDILLPENVIVKTSLPSKTNSLNLKKIHYIIFIIQRYPEDPNTTSSVINLIDLAKKHQSKIAIVDIHKNQIQEELTDATFRLLSQISTKPLLFRYLITKDLFQDYNSNATFALEQDIQLVSYTQKIEISSDGENPIYPLNIKDLIAATLKSLFLERLAGQKLTIIGDPLTDLELAYMIKEEQEKIGKTLNIDTTLKNTPPLSSISNASTESKALLKWLPQDANENKLKTKISELVRASTLNQARIFSPPTEVKSKKPLKKISLHKIEKKFLISIPITLISIAVFSLLIISSLYIFLLGTSLKKTKTSLDYLNKGSIEKVNQEIQLAAKYLQTGEEISRYLLPVYQVISLNLTANVNNFSSLLKHSQSTIQSVNESYQLANNLYHDLFTPSGDSSAKDISIAIQSRLRTIHQELSQIKIIQENHSQPAFLNQKLKKIDFVQKINTLINQTAQSLKLLESFSDLLDSSSPQYLALLVQDGNQLKSSGGTIKSVVLANIENQKIINIRVLSAGQIDQQMVGQIPSPTIIETLIGQAGLSFANSNTSPSFIENSILISKFLKNSINFTPDLIIGFSAQTLKDIYPENQDLNLLLEKVIQGVQTQTISLIRLVRPVINSLNQDNLRIWFKDPAKENSILNSSLSGNVFPSFCHPLLNAKNCFSDLACLTENNFSAVPLDLSQNRQLQHQVAIQDRSVLHSFILDYQYKDIPQELINRNYPALYQIHLHPSAQFISLEINNQKTDVTIAKEFYNNLSFFQIPLLHSPQEIVSVKINFVLKDILPADSFQDFAYSIKTFHQPGTNQQNNQLIINYPSSLVVSSITSPASINSEKIIFQPLMDLNLNSVFGVQFASRP